MFGDNAYLQLVCRVFFKAVNKLLPEANMSRLHV